MMQPWSVATFLHGLLARRRFVSDRTVCFLIFRTTRVQFARARTGVSMSSQVPRPAAPVEVDDYRNGRSPSGKYRVSKYPVYREG